MKDLNRLKNQTLEKFSEMEDNNTHKRDSSSRDNLTSMLMVTTGQERNSIDDLCEALFNLMFLE